ncbi:MAG: deoxyribodipyrimidine photo-lyase [Oceanospirillaceae bacterium]|jgi:deoxyribodipyrimidine photo-lyase
MTQLVWLRNDLRLLDNPALYHACKTGQPVRVIYCATPLQWQKHHESPVQLALRQSLLKQLSASLAMLGIPLDVLETSEFKQLPKLINQYCVQHAITVVWINKQSWLNEKLRDKQVAELLACNNIKLHSFTDELLVNTPITTKDLTPYRVFTPWYKQWLIKLQGSTIEILPTPSAISAPIMKAHTHIILPLATKYRDDLWPGSEQHAIKQLIDFCDHHAIEYEQRRDYPGIRGTSLLSPYLAVGAISIRQCYVYLQQACLKQQAPWPEQTWLKELGWREFYRYLMINKPDIAKGAAFNPHKEPKWLDNPEHFKAWQEGRTGFPIIDAAMLQLKRTGWMHNRLRMLTASFLCKLLLIDWRKGEAYFMQHLIDADFSSNNGGWQWSASTGCDASPWFRIFNPKLQSEKFDSKGLFIRKMLPQLNALNDRDIHQPNAEQRKLLNYSEPIIDYAASRARAINWQREHISL